MSDSPKLEAPQLETPMSRDVLDGVLQRAAGRHDVRVTDEQWACISAPLEPFVIVAGAGTGKTFVMAARVLWLVGSGLVAEHEVLGLTFTNKAAAELASRVNGMLDVWRREQPVGANEHVGEPTIATYHSFARRLIDEQGLRVGIEPGSRLLSPAAVAQLAHRVVCDADHLVACARFAPSRLTAEVMGLDANLAEQTISTDELRAHDSRVIGAIDGLPKVTRAIQDIKETAARRMELADLVDRVRAERVRVGGLDFADHMRLCVDLVRGSEDLVGAMRATYRVVLLDEYQDTSIAQRVILSTLFAGGAVTAVGDPLQAIYGWRSASVANIASFGAHFGVEGQAPVRVLSVNRRSGEPILAAANRVAADLRDAHPEVAELRPPAPRHADVRVALLPTIADEREWIADQVADLVAAGRTPGEIAVLGRTNESLEPIQAALAERGVPASISGAAAISASPYAREVLATLRVLNDPADNTALVTLLAGPRWRIGPADLEALARRADLLAAGPSQRRRRREAAERPDVAVGGLRERLSESTVQPDPVEQPSLLEAAADPGGEVSAVARRRLAEFVAEVGVMHRRVGDPLPDLVAAVAQALGVAVEAVLPRTAADVAGSAAGLLGAAAGIAVASAPGDAGLDGLLQLVDGFSDAEGRSGLGAFLAYLDAAEQSGPGEQVDLPIVPGAVQLMTMHKAKGLEFPVVVLPHVSRDVFPGKVGSERWTTQPHVVPVELRDDRHVLPRLDGYTTRDLNDFIAACRAHDRSGDDRLAYVAVTRARDVLLASGHWWGPTQKGRRGPSPYLEALRDQAAESAEALFVVGDPWAEEPEDSDEAPAANPMLELVHEVPWPVPDLADHDPIARAAAAVRALVDSGRTGDRWLSTGAGAGGGQDSAGVQLDMASAADPDGVGQSAAVARQVAEWDAAIEALLARVGESGAQGPLVEVPGVLSASATMELAQDPDGFAERLLRPMPRRRSRHADLGTAFHAWVESRLGVQPLITDDELPGAADAGIESAEELASLKDAFERLPYAARTPVGLEVPFSLPVGGRVIRGRIDAVFPAGPEAADGQRWEVVDWKTSARDEADPLQLAIYRLAWADLAGVPVGSVGAAFVFVRSGTVVRPEDLPDADGIAQLLAGDQGGGEA
jgi:DNA helicase-2/ATP-dependent DNA helicase PcrA